MSRAEASWERGRIDRRAGPATLLFGRMFEDAEIEAALVPPGAEVFCIASAGCTALWLAGRGHRVTAVDVNPAQAAYVEARSRGAPPAEGQVDRLLALARRRLRSLGGDEGALREFLLLGDPAAQLRTWRDHPDATRWREVLGESLGGLLARAGAGPAGSLRPPPVEVVLGRLERGLGRHPNRDNPYLWHLLLGTDPPGLPPPAGPARGALSVHVADAVVFLEAAPPGRFGALSLSNLSDVLAPDRLARLRAAAAQAAAPGAVVIERSFAAAAEDGEESWALRDRSLLWGSVRVTSPQRTDPQGRRDSCGGTS